MCAQIIQKLTENITVLIFHHRKFTLHDQSQISRDDRASAQSQLAAFLAAHRHFEQLTLIRPCARVTLNAIMVNLQCPPPWIVLSAGRPGNRLQVDRTAYRLLRDFIRYSERNQLTRWHANTAWACMLRLRTRPRMLRFFMGSDGLFGVTRN